MNWLNIILFFIFSFVLVLLMHIFVINRGRKEYKEGKKLTEINYIVKRFNLDMRKIKYSKLKWTVTFANSFIVAFTSAVVVLFDNIFMQLAVGFIFLVALIFAIYEIIGRIFARKGSKK